MSEELPPLPVRHMTRWDFYGVLFVNFPVAWTFEESRLELERKIRAVGESEITPMTIDMAFYAERVRLMRGRWKREDTLAALKEHAARFNAARKDLRNEEDWSF